MKWPVVVKSPGATLQMIGLPASKAAVTEEASAGTSSDIRPSFRAPSLMSSQDVSPPET